MSVFTQISHHHLEQLLENYDVGQLKGFQGIDGGTDNSNYFVDTEQGRFVLTIFERLKSDELDFYLSLGEQLHDAGNPVAQPYHQTQGPVIYPILDKPAVLFQCLDGRHIAIPDTQECYQMGVALAKIHSTELTFDQVPENSFGLSWIGQHRNFNRWSSEDDRQLFTQILDRLESLDLSGLSKGVIHADLFHDNALFEQGTLKGIIDWYFACHDWYMLDLAIMINDWCFEGAVLNTDRYDAMVRGYCRQRQVSDQELELLGEMQLLGAMRFWLSRAIAANQHAGKDQQGITVKPPEEFRQKILAILEGLD